MQRDKVNDSQNQKSAAELVDEWFEKYSIM